MTDNALFPTRLLRPLDIQFFGLALRAAGLNDVKNRNDLPLVTQSILHAVRIPWPSALSEQRAIATTLSDVDALLGSLDRLIAKKRNVNQAAMQQLLTGQPRLPGFQGEWEEKTLGRLGEFSKGKGIRKNDVRDAGLPCIRYGEIYTHHANVIRSFRSFISRDVARESRRLRAGELVFAGSGETAEEIGKCVAFVGDEEAYVGGDTILLSPAGHDSRFLGYLLNQPWVSAQKARMGQGDAVVHISVRNLASVKVSIPSKDEQQAIGQVLSDMDAEIAALEQRRDKTRHLKQGMMQELLTGRTRLV